MKGLLQDVELTAPGKLLALLLVIIGCFGYIIVATWTGQGDTTPAWATLTLVVGYLIGNGTGARKGQPTIAPFTPSAERQIERLEHEIYDRDTQAPRSN